MDFNLFKEIINEASRYGKRSFSLHLFGEPLLYPRIHDAINYVKSCNKKHTVLLTTNGTKLNELFDSVKEADQILWSWRREAKFTDETKRKLLRWGRFKVRFISEVTPKEAYKEWEKWPNKEVRSLHNYGGEIDLSKFSAISNSENKNRWPCYHLWLAPAVAWNGNILICCADPHQKEVIGKFKEQDVSDVWRGTRLNNIRKSHLEGKYFGICKNCDVWRSYPSFF